MKKLSKEKRQQLILTVLITATVLFGLWYGLIRTQRNSIAQIEAKRATAEGKLTEVKQTVARADQIRVELDAASAILNGFEDKMASGDLYAWSITTIRNFKSNYKVEIPQYSQIAGPRDFSAIPDFPYKEVSLTVAGTGQFHDVGTFIADFENANPFTRVCNLVLEPSTGGTELLNFRMDVVALVKPKS